MIYTASAHDARLLSFSRELVRDAFRVLRDSESIAHAQRTRDALAEMAYAEAFRPIATGSRPATEPRRGRG